MRHWGASSEYQQHMISWRNKKNITTFGWKKNALSGAMNASKSRYGAFIWTCLLMTACFDYFSYEGVTNLTRPKSESSTLGVQAMFLALNFRMDFIVSLKLYRFY